MGKGQALVAAKLKRDADMTHEGVNYGNVCATRLYDISLKGTVKALLRVIFFTYDVSMRGEGKALNIYSYRGHNRPDYDYIFDRYCAYYNECQILEFSYKMSLHSLPIRVKALAFWLSRLKHKNHRLLIASVAAEADAFRCLLEKVLNQDKITLVTTFCDAHGIENMAAQIANNRGITTATLQHGQYRFLGKKHENADMEAYANFVSDYLLAWGEITKTEFEKAGVDPRRIVLAGALKPFSYNAYIETDNDNSIFGVVLSGENLSNSNQKMIAIAEEISSKIGMKYFLRFHPKNPQKKYYALTGANCIKEFRVSPSAYPKIVAFSLVHMTGVFVELLSYNSPIFIYKDEHLEKIFELEDATFANLSEFMHCYSDYSRDKKLFREKQHEQYHYFNQENIDANYQSFIRSALESNDDR